MVFFVTGGSRGIGAAIVEQASAEGHQVAFTYQVEQESAQQVIARAKETRADADVKAYQLDIRSSTEVERVGDAVLEDFDRVDVVVANAGINRLNLLVSIADEEWDEVMQTNLTGPFYVARQFLPAMIAQRFGRFIMISSVGYTGVTGQAAYCASKAGLHGLASTISKEYGRKGITANVVVPGYFDTDMSREGISASNKEFLEKYCPRGRMGHMHEISKLVTFLASDGADYINGQLIPVNGGLDWAP